MKDNNNNFNNNHKNDYYYNCANNPHIDSNNSAGSNYNSNFNTNTPPPNQNNNFNQYNNFNPNNPQNKPTYNGQQNIYNPNWQPPPGFQAQQPQNNTPGNQNTGALIAAVVCSSIALALGIIGFFGWWIIILTIEGAMFGTFVTIAGFALGLTGIILGATNLKRKPALGIPAVAIGSVALVFALLNGMFSCLGCMIDGCVYNSW